MAIGATLVSYSLTDMIHGFLSVFVPALMLRHYERQHQFHHVLHETSENMERLFMAPLLVVFGGILISVGSCRLSNGKRHIRTNHQ
jgi:sodium/hydrogen antiporter